MLTDVFALVSLGFEWPSGPDQSTGKRAQGCSGRLRSAMATGDSEYLPMSSSGRTRISRPGPPIIAPLCKLSTR